MLDFLDLSRIFTIKDKRYCKITFHLRVEKQRVHDIPVGLKQSRAWRRRAGQIPHFAE